MRDLGSSLCLTLAVEHGPKDYHHSSVTQVQMMPNGPGALLMGSLQFMKHVFAFQRVKHGRHFPCPLQSKQELKLIFLEEGKLFYCRHAVEDSSRSLSASIYVLRTRTQTSIKAWDHAAGMICVHEAGGKVTDWEGSQIDLAADAAERRIVFASGGVIVSNGTEAKDLVKKKNLLNVCRNESAQRLSRKSKDPSEVEEAAKMISIGKDVSSSVERSEQHGIAVEFKLGSRL
ncbi:hypothetical protein NL676_007879 [Syzygium grande]|nr:hypothetical protein NL676_007879 [Syzygium grande]